MRRRYTTALVWTVTLVIVLACVGWALLVQSAVPDACSYPSPPARAQFLQCSSQP